MTSRGRANTESGIVLLGQTVAPMGFIGSIASFVPMSPTSHISSFLGTAPIGAAVLPRFVARYSHVSSVVDGHVDPLDSDQQRPDHV